MSGHTALFMMSFNVSHSVTLARELKLAVTIARCKWASQALLNIPKISSSPSCFHHFSGSFLMNSLPLGGSSSGTTMSIPPFVMCWCKYIHARSYMDLMTTLGPPSVIMCQSFAVNFLKVLIHLGSASLLSLCSISV